MQQPLKMLNIAQGSNSPFKATNNSPAKATSSSVKGTNSPCKATNSPCKLPFLKQLRVSPELDEEISTPTMLAMNRNSVRPSAWSELPDHLLESIFSCLEPSTAANSQQLQFSVCGVCLSWRRVGKNLFFKNPWTSSNSISHPKQLFTLSPYDCGLVKCYIRREVVSTSRVGPLHKFCLYCGPDYAVGPSKFLLLALQSTKSKYNICLGKDEKQAPCAVLSCNLLRTKYSLKATDGDWPQRLFREAGSVASGSQGSLLKVNYQMRVRGLMLPRRMSVTLPKPSTLHSNPLFSAKRGEPVSDPDQSNAVPVLCPLSGAAELEAGDSTPIETVSEFLTPQPPSDLGRLGADAEPAVAKLQNKPPHWNEALKCWCLNFKGRVKFASVKNFQLMASEDENESVVMQFGKVDKDVFVLDYNPYVLSAFQAFSVCLTTYETKYLL